MNMKACENGHYYDQDKNNKCPYCEDSNSKLNNICNSNTDESTQMLHEKIVDEVIEHEKEETKMLLSTSKSSFNTIPIVEKLAVELAGWIVTVSEKGKGEVYNITYGMNTIGRAVSNQIRIENGDSSISREKHASIIYDFENNLFFIQHHEGKYLTYLNRNMVSGLVELKAYDTIKVGKSEFIFVPLCGEKFKWEDNEN